MRPTRFDLDALLLDAQALVPKFQLVGSRRNFTQLILSVKICHSEIRMVRHDNIGSHPRVHFALNLDEAGRNQWLAAYAPGIEPYVKLGLIVGKSSVCRVKNRIRVF